MTPLEQVGQESAQQRWERLRSRYQPMLAEGVTAETAPAAKAPKAAEQSRALPMPAEEDSYRWAATRRNFAAPLPDGSEEPAWVVSAAPVEPQVVEKAPVPMAPVATAPAPTSEADIIQQVSPLDEVATVAAQADVTLPPMPAAEGETQEPTARRPVRDISEIQPFYDTKVDEDIREYAASRAAAYHVQFGDEAYTPRAFADTAIAWAPTDFYNFPLYFEDPALERYGHTYPFVVQPFVSVARFSGQLLALPYQMTLDPINKPVYALGWYRPGEVAPKLKYQIPWNAQAAAVQAGVTTGMFFLIP